MVTASKKESTYSFSGMLKKGDVDDDEMRTSVSQNFATAVQSYEEFFLRTQYI
jgi:hypothetical protein